MSDIDTKPAGREIWDQFRTQSEQPPESESGGRLPLIALLLVAVAAGGGWLWWTLAAPGGQQPVAQHPVAQHPVAVEVAAEAEAEAVTPDDPIPKRAIEPLPLWLLGKNYLALGETTYAGVAPAPATAPGEPGQPPLLTLVAHLNRPEVWLYKGERALAQGDNETARSAFETAVELDPGAVFALSGLVRALLASGQMQAARAPVAMLAHNFPTDPAAAYVRALYARQDTDYGPALQALTIVLNREPDHPLGMLLLGDVQLAMGNPEQALFNLGRFHNLVPESVQGRNLLARSYIAMGQPARAMTLLEPLVDRVQDYPEIADSLSAASTAMGRNLQGQLYRSLAGTLGAEGVVATIAPEYLGIEAHQATIGALEMAASGSAAQMQRELSSALSALRDGQTGALDALTQGLLWDAPEAARMHYLFGCIAQTQGDIAAAVWHYHRARSLDSGLHAAQLALARLQDHEANARALTDRLEAARERSATALRPRLQLADSYLQQRRIDSALALNREVQALAPQHPVNNYMLANGLIQAGDVRAGVQLLEPLEQAHGDNLALKWRLIEAYQWLGEAAPARAVLQRVLAVDTRNSRAMVKLALLQRRAGNTQAVAALLQNLKQQHPGLGTPYLLAAQLAIDEQDLRSAADLLERALQLL